MIKDFKSLIGIEFLHFKSYKRYLLSNPLSAIKEFMSTAGSILFFSMYIAMILIFKDNSKIGKFFGYIGKDYIAIDYIVMSILLIIFLYNLLKSENTYSSLLFSSNDVQYLFPSPIGERSVFLFYLIKEALKFFFQYIMIGIFFIYAVKVMPYKIFLGALGFILVYLFIKGFNFLIFSLRTRIQCRKQIRIFTVIYLIMSLGYGLYSLIIKNEPFKVLGPWQLTKFIVYPIKSTGLTSIDFVIMVVLVALIMFFAITYAVDYYGEIGEAVSGMEEASAKLKDVDNIVMEESIKKDAKIVSYKDNFLTKINGAGAFLYKAYIFNKRNNAHKRVVIASILGFILSTSFVVLATMKNFESKIIWSISFGIGYLFMNFSYNSRDNLKYELSKMYFSLIPDKIYKKLIYIGIYDLILRSIPMIILIFPCYFLSAINRAQLLLYQVSIPLVGLFILSVNNIFAIFTPLDIKTSESILKGIGAIVMVLILGIPVAGINFLFGESNLSFLLIFLSFILLNIIMIFISDKLFSTIEK